MYKSLLVPRSVSLFSTDSFSFSSFPSSNLIFNHYDHPYHHHPSKPTSQLLSLPSFNKNIMIIMITHQNHLHNYYPPPSCKKKTAPTKLQSLIFNHYDHHYNNHHLLNINERKHDQPSSRASSPSLQLLALPFSPPHSPLNPHCVYSYFVLLS